jgi:hypothetical protein
MFIRNFGSYTDYTALYSRIWQKSLLLIVHELFILARHFCSSDNSLSLWIIVFNIVGCNAVETGRSIPTFRRNIRPQSVKTTNVRDMFLRHVGTFLRTLRSLCFIYLISLS